MILKNLKLIREQNGMSINDLAEETKYPPFYIETVEKGLDVSPVVAHWISDILAVPLVDLTGDDPEVIEPPGPTLESLERRIEFLEGSLQETLEQIKKLVRILTPPEEDAML